MSSSGTAYKYTVPLDNGGGVSTPMYEVSGNGEILSVQVHPRNVVVVCTKACPHFHRDSVNVTVEEVNEDEYKGD